MGELEFILLANKANRILDNIMSMILEARKSHEEYLENH